ncbi:MAG: hypothetical protein JXR68_09360 [Bacteroidales bacterium]|nr:hypothetical protein [Bacteroidales bacterium]
MKKKWLWIVIILIVVLLFFGFLYSKGLINVKWQWLAVILAGAAGPFRFFSNLFSGKSVRSNQFVQSHQDRIDATKQHRIVYDQAIQEKEEKIKELEVQVNVLEQKIDDLELSQQQVHDQVSNMNDDDLQDAFLNLYGDEA